jgi:hypothetical protein
MMSDNPVANGHVLSSHAFMSLPIAVYREFQQYLSRSEYNQVLLTSDKKFFQKVVKLQTIKYDINHYYSEVYLKSESFRRDVRSKLQSPKDQLSLRYEDTHFINPAILTDLNSLSLSKIKSGFKLSDLKGIASLTLSDIDFLESCQGITDIKHIKLMNLPNLVDISALKRLATVEIKNCPLVQDILPLKRVEKLTLINCIGVSDVSLLGKIRSLTFISCPNIGDVSCLSYVYDLTIRHCDNIVNASRLTNNTHLSLINNRSPPDLRSFRQVNSLEINFDGLNANVKPLLRCLSLTLIDANFITNLYLLKKLQVLQVESCNIESLTLPANHNIRKITIAYCDHLHDVSFLNSIPFVIIRSCKKITSLNALWSQQQTQQPAIQSITVDTCNNILDFSPLNGISRVKIVSCWGFSNACDVMNVNHLTLSNCANIKDVSVLRNVAVLDLWYCYQVKNIQDLTYNYKITAIKHYKITDFDVLLKWYSYQDIDGVRIFLSK